MYKEITLGLQELEMKTEEQKKMEMFDLLSSEREVCLFERRLALAARDHMKSDAKGKSKTALDYEMQDLLDLYDDHNEEIECIEGDLLDYVAR